MRECISRQEPVGQKAKGKGQIASRRVCGIAGSLLMAAPASALACPVCGLVGTSDNTWAYQVMSAMLTFLPLAMIGATVWWVARLVARADTDRGSAAQHGVDRDGRRLKSLS